MGVLVKGKRTAMGRLMVLVSVALVAIAVTDTGDARAEFGISAFDQQITANQAGAPYTTAGGHPYAVTTDVILNSHPDTEFEFRPGPDADPKDVITELPPGMIGNPAGIPQCTTSELTPPATAFSSNPSPECPIGSIVGVVHLDNTHPLLLDQYSWLMPLYNMAPPPGAPAEFGFNVEGEAITLTGNVRNGGDFGVTVVSHNIPNALPLYGVELTFWGDPADPSHDAQRCDTKFIGSGVRGTDVCEGEAGTTGGPNSDPLAPTAFLTLPVNCTAPGVGMKTTLKVDSWPDPGVYSEDVLYNHLMPGFPSPVSEWGPEQALEGCESVPFNPSFAAQATSLEAASPTGLNVDLSIPQEGLLSPEGIAPADLKDATITLPAGMAVSPSAAHGLAGCTEEEMGVGNGEEAKCPDASKIGSVEIVTPLLEEPMHGAMYLATQEANPFKSLFALYLIVEAHGVRVKVPGRIDLDPATGQLTVSFKNTPQLPFSDLKVDLKSGPRAPLVTPEACGTYTTNAVLTPWSGNAPVTRESTFAVTSGPGGSPCPTAAFKPGFTAGLVNNQAGSFSPFSLTFSRGDGEQQLGGISVKMPPGLVGTLAKVALCKEPQASQGTCGPESEIGHTIVGVGDGAEPFWVEGGKVYITEAYGGGQYGLSVVVPAVAGPFNLGVVVVRAAIHVDPITAQLTIDAGALPSILDGIPLDINTVNVLIDRPEFMLNPTNCSPLAVDGTIDSTSGASAAVSSHFQSANCAALPFAPKMSVWTSGNPSRVNGASLRVRIVEGSRNEANVAKVKVELPKQLPSRLTTLQKACPSAVFEANPAGCPTESIVGSATATTPILPVALNGPAYFVSNGGQKFPELVIVLQGYGVTVELHGETFISKAGITSTTFNTVPDVFVIAFELNLPEGRYSALTAAGNLCTAKLRMPTTITAQNGAVLNKDVPVMPTGCPKHKSTHKHTKHKQRKKHTSRG